MKRFLHASVIITLILVTTACKTSFRISVLTPPPILLNDSTRKILVVNNVTDDNSPDKLLAQVLQGQQYNGNVMASEQSVTGFIRSLDDSRYLKAIAGEPISLRSNETINWQKVDSLCAVKGTHAIVEIEHFDSQAPIGGTVLANATGQTNHPLKGWAYINLYIAGTHEHVDRLDVYEVYNMPITGGLNPIGMLNDVVRKRELYGHLGYSIGYRMGSLFYSNWIWVSRRFYNKGSRTLRHAKPLIRSGNWNLAEKQLEMSINSPKNKVAGRSKYNMALVYEGQGRLDEAIAMAERAALEHGTKLAYDYINTLKRRKGMRSTIVLTQD